MSLERIIYSQLDLRLDAQTSFEKKLIKQHEHYTQAVQTSLDTEPGQPLGVSYIPLTQRDIDNLYAHYDDEDQIRALIAAGKRHAIIKDVLSERDMQIITDLLKKLEKNGTLYNALVQYNNYDGAYDSATELEKKTIIMVSLQNAGILPVIQYVICDSLLTCGLGCGQTYTSVAKNPAALIQELIPLIAATGFTLDDFFLLANQKVILHKSITEMAVTLDNPEILLAVMQKDKFLMQDIEQPQHNFLYQSIEDLVISNRKTAIKKRMYADIVASYIAHTPKKQPEKPQNTGQNTADTVDITSWTTERLTPTHNKMTAANNKPKNSVSTIAMSPYGSGKLHLHASRAIVPLQDTVLLLLISTVCNIIDAAEMYIEKHPKPVRKITGHHTDQEDARLLIACGKKFHEDIVTASATDTAKIALKFLLTFYASINNLLTGGELLKALLTKKILSPISLAAQTIMNRNCDEHTAVDVKTALEHLTTLSTLPTTRAGISILRRAAQQTKS
jgi:hypothetical protein